MDIIEALERFGRLQWYQVTPSRTASDEQRRFPPFVSWRFEQPNENVEKAIEGAVKAFKGSIEWELGNSDKTWFLLPKRAADLRRAEQLINVRESILRLGDSDPDFGRKAHLELIRIVDAILGIDPSR